MCLILCAPLDWKYAEFLPLACDACDAALYMYVTCESSNKIKK